MKNAYKFMSREALLLEYLGDVCVGLGYCLPPLIKEDMAKNPGTSPEGFVRRIIQNEGLEPNQFPDHYDEMLKMLRERVGQKIPAIQ